MKILYVSQYFPPEMGAPAARVAELSRHWVDAGHEVTVLTGFPNHPTGVVPREYRRKLWRLAAREKFGRVDVVRTWLLPFPNRKMHERILNYGSFCLSSGGTGLLLPRPDVVIATSPQLLVGLSGWWLAQMKKVPLVLEIRDLWPESLAAVGMGSCRSPLYRMLARLAALLYRKAEHIVVVTPAFKEYLIANCRVPREKIWVAENGVETDLFSPRRRVVNDTAEASGKFVVSYIGTMGMAHGLETLLEAAFRLKDSAPQVHFVLIGEGAEKEKLLTTARARGLTNVRFVDQQPHQTIPEHICASDACLVLLKKADLFKTVLPTKLLEFMSCARPVIISVDGQARDIVEKANAGIFVEPGNPGELADAILRLAANPAWCESLGCNGRRYVVQNFSRRQTAEKYLELLSHLLGENMPRAAAA